MQLQFQRDEVNLMNRRRILILDFDLFRSVGGGQTVYKKIIAAHSNADFFYFAEKEDKDAVRPANAHAIPYLECYDANANDLPDAWVPHYNEFEHAWRLAGSIISAFGHCYFDVVDVPDYTRRGLFIRQALEAHGITVGAVTLALHGVISQPVAWRWYNQDQATTRVKAVLRVQEHLQYRSVDSRYAISRKYSDEWKRKTGFGAFLIDPTDITGRMAPVAAEGEGPPVLLFVGRRERRKGPDIFLDLAWCLRKGSFSKIVFIGAPDAKSDDILLAMAKERELEIEFRDPVSPAELDDIFRSRVVLFCPSKVDTFLLVALEALRLGCPTFVTPETGFSQWMLEHFPDLGDFVVDIECDRSAALNIEKALLDYDNVRSRLCASLASPASIPDYNPVGLTYDAPIEFDRKARHVVGEMTAHLHSFFRPYISDTSVSPASLFVDSENPLVPHVIAAPEPPEELAELANHFVHQAHVSRNLGEDLRKMPELSTWEVERKLERIDREVDLLRIVRVPLFAEMARLERKRGNDYISATYHLRIMRWLGQDRFDALGYVSSVLRKRNQPAVAEIAEAMYGDPAQAFARCLDLLDRQYERNLVKPDLPLAILDDRRRSQPYRVAVIVSLYNAESKLPTLLANVALQTLARRGEVEVVLVDSNSPTDEYGAFRRYMADHSLDVLYSRSAERETIQAAWNRGIKLARAPYLCFLGADEGLHPECLELLSQALDRAPEVDWITADSVVTDVDRKGRFDRDIMSYRREGLSRDLQQLECCYVNYVGGLYRKSIHDRFGYYDETFRGAGDTEFKARLLPWLNVTNYPRMLGVFNNYPEARTTASPLAELEDTRAWYLHRTPAGMAYRFRNESDEAILSLLRNAMTYRKSYSNQRSTDFDLAAALSQYLFARNPGSMAHCELHLKIVQLLNGLRFLEQHDFSATRDNGERVVKGMLNWFHGQREVIAKALDLPALPAFRLSNDNRYEQHSWSWNAVK